jgi:hypothetical protein
MFHGQVIGDDMSRSIFLLLTVLAISAPGLISGILDQQIKIGVTILAVIVYLVCVLIICVNKKGE